MHHVKYYTDRQDIDLPFYFKIRANSTSFNETKGDSLYDNLLNKRCVGPYCTKLVIDADPAEVYPESRRAPITLALVTIHKKYFDPIVVDSDV